MRSRLVFLIAGGALILPAVARTQTSPFLPDPLYRDLINEVSGDRAFEDIRHLSHYHRTDGSRDFFAAAEWIRGAAAAAGLEDVKLIRQSWDGHGWSCASGEAWLVEPEELKLAAYGAVAVSIADNSRTTHVTADLVDVGGGASEKDYQGKDVKGRIVLASGSLAKVQEEAVWKRGALGVLSYVVPTRQENLDFPDHVAWGRLPYDAKDVTGVKDATPSTFAVMISPQRGRRIARQMADAAKPFRLKVDIEASFPEKAEQALVEAWIHGSEVHDQQIVLTAHIQEEMTSANDDGSGCASMLEIGRALSRLIRDGKVPRPRRDIRFWWTNELQSEPQYFRENPKEPRKMLLDIQQDMVGARQSWGGRVQYAARLPWSLPHALEDVMESVLTAVRDGNTALLNLWRSPTPQPFSREIVAIKGSREPFHARMVPYFGHSDHHAFTLSRVGVPATALINWPDDFIHSTGDDLDNVDATQLERNAVIVAGVAFYFASLGDDDVPALAACVASRARARAALDLATAVTHVAQSAPADRDAAFRAARNLVHQSHEKERGALASVKRLAAKGRTADYIAQASTRLEEVEGGDLAALERAFTAIAGRNPPNVTLAKEEREMAARVFVPVADLGAYQDAMEKVKHTDGLRRIVEFEVYNFADGRRNAFEIYEAVAAEALSAGEWHSGTVKPADVLKALEEGVRAGAFTPKGGK